MRRLSCLAVICVIVFDLAFRSHSFLAAQGNSSASRTPVSDQGRVPFVGCQSDGQTGPLDAPKVAKVEVRLDAKIAARLALYSPENGPAVLGPRGWSCFGGYGSAQTDLMLTPTSLDPSDRFNATLQGNTGFGIQASQVDGGTSGRFTAGQLVARVFPAHRSFVEQVIAEGILAASNFPSGPFPADHLTYRSDRIVEYETPPRSQGLGTYFQLLPNSDSIRGVAMLTPDFDVRHLALRLPQDMNDISPVIIRQFEAGN